MASLLANATLVASGDGSGHNRRVGTLFVAAGGGGDAVAILLAQRLLAPGESGPPAIATCAWERLIVDPAPGPRSPEGFTGLRDHIGVFEILADSDTVPPRRSMLPRLVRESGARVFLLDLSEGVHAMARQLLAAATVIRADRIVVVDSGGDAIATGAEPSLKSPLADAMGIASAIATGLPVELAVIGPGADGELSEAEVLARFEELSARFVGPVDAGDAARLTGVMRWHPTEASAIVGAAAQGHRPVVAMRRGGQPFVISDHTAGVWVVEPAIESLPLAQLVTTAPSLEEAAAMMGRVSVDELDFERQKATTEGAAAEGPGLDGLRADVQAGATHVTLRRARELTGEVHPVGTYGTLALEADLPGLLALRPSA